MGILLSFNCQSITFGLFIKEVYFFVNGMDFERTKNNRNKNKFTNTPDLKNKTAVLPSNLQSPKRIFFSGGGSVASF